MIKLGKVSEETKAKRPPVTESFGGQLKPLDQP
jgi:hypothetical protein